MIEAACVVDARDALGECCLWCPATQKIWWVDVLRPCLQSFEPATGAHRVYPLPGRFCGCAVRRASGGLVLALDEGLHSFDPETGSLDFLVQAEPAELGNRYNDGRCDRAGRLWIGTMDPDIQKASGSFYRIGVDLSVLKLLDGVTVPNSTAFSPDDKVLYFADTPRHTIWAFDFDIAGGTISDRRVFADLTERKGLPDGSCVDAEGFLWNAEYGGGQLTRYAPDGRVDRTIPVPVTNPTCCCFGGPAFSTLYITSAMPEGGPDPGRHDGGLLALDAGTRGLPEATFGG